MCHVTLANSSSQLCIRVNNLLQVWKTYLYDYQYVTHIYLYI